MYGVCKKESMTMVVIAASSYNGISKTIYVIIGHNMVFEK